MNTLKLYRKKNITYIQFCKVIYNIWLPRKCNSTACTKLVLPIETIERKTVKRCGEHNDKRDREPRWRGNRICHEWQLNLVSDFLHRYRSMFSGEHVVLDGKRKIFIDKIKLLFLSKIFNKVMKIHRSIWREVRKNVQRWQLADNYWLASIYLYLRILFHIFHTFFSPRVHISYQWILNVRKSMQWLDTKQRNRNKEKRRWNFFYINE